MNEKVLVTNIQRFSLHDGPGIRTTIFFKGCTCIVHGVAIQRILAQFNKNILRTGKREFMDKICHYKKYIMK